ncbi:MAG: hypothetical protein LUP94_00375, partial [Candidatus Methanomethylicus sp.]|nr:hypothetical protein [Candidatus Methanomethylicus sp.]
MLSRGVSPVVATLLLVMIVVAAAFVIMGIVRSDMFSPNTGYQVNKDLENLKTVQVKALQDDTFRIYVLNKGGVDIVIDRLYMKDGFGNVVAVVTVGNVTVKVDQIKEIYVDGYGLDSWKWFDITFVTERGNQFNAELYGKLGANFPYNPYFNMSEYLFYVSRVTVNDMIVNNSQVYQNLSRIDGSTYNLASQYMVDLGNVSTPASSYEYDFGEGQYATPKNNIAGLAYPDGLSNYIQYETKVDPAGVCSLSAQFNGKTGNYKYPYMMLTFIFDMNTARLPSMRGTVQFYDWVLNAYVNSGNGFLWFDQNNATLTSYIFQNFTTMIEKGNLLGPNGEWSMVINMTTDNPTVMKWDYIAVTEMLIYFNGIETILHYNVSANVNDAARVMKLTFSTTGIFPLATSSYWFSVYNFNTNQWQYLGLIVGSP